jgi:hypothetical protein
MTPERWQKITNVFHSAFTAFDVNSAKRFASATEFFRQLEEALRQ